jgi:tetratricopeptide (TPR) repeat protein
VIILPNNRNFVLMPAGKNITTLMLGLIVLSALTFSACNSTKKSISNNSPQEKPEKSLTEEQIVNLRYLYVEGVKQKILGNYKQAIDLFSQCIRIDGKNHAAMYEIATIQQKQNNIIDAIFFARSAAEINPGNTWYTLFLGELYMNSGKYNEAEKLFKNLYENNPDELDLAYKYAAVLLFNGKIIETIRVYDEIEKVIGVSPDLIIDKKSLYLRLGKTEKAAVEIEKLIARYPLNMRYYSMLVELYQVNEMPDEAYETIGRMQEIKPESPYVYLALSEYYRSVNKNDESFQQLKLAFGSLELESDVKIKIISSYLPLVEENPDMRIQAITLSEILANTHPGESIAQAIYGDFLMIEADYLNAAQQYLKSIAIDPIIIRYGNNC